MSKINQNRWDCTSCGVNQGPNDLWHEGDICGDCNAETEREEKKKEVISQVIDMFDRIGIDMPSNFDEIADYIFQDVDETADPVEWHDGDVAIAFRRWIEAQAKPD